MKKPYVKSNYARKANDDYKTVDPRCIQALVESWKIYLDDTIIDCCSPSGSAIIDRLVDMGFDKSSGVSDAFSEYEADWCITNPPYTRKLVDEIIWKQISNISAGRVYGAAVLLRNNFDFAKGRYEMFSHKYYMAQIHMMFRPWWSEEKKHQPIHNYVWHIWQARNVYGDPVVKYWTEKK